MQDLDKVRDRVRELLEGQQVIGFLGLRQVYGHPSPHLFTKEKIKDLDQLTLTEEIYPLTKILLRLISKYPDQNFGSLVRGCDEKALVELHKHNQLDINKLILVGVACTEDLAKRCSCTQPYPSEFVAGTKTKGVEDRAVLEKIEKLAGEDRLNFWYKNFSKCMKCMGCKNICPLCFCPECVLQDDKLIPTGEVPPQFLVFHLTRAICMTARCIDCGMCEEACPADIPLRSLYKKIKEKIGEFFQYTPGSSIDERSPLSFLGDEESLKQLRVAIGGLEKEL